MKPTDLLRLLGEFSREKAGLRDRHAAVARSVSQYDLNNTYQYVIAREDQHLAWLADAVRDGGGSAAPAGPVVEVAPVSSVEGQQALMGEDARGLDEFVARWRPRLESVTNARHKLMMQLILGEVEEAARLFRQGAGGRLDLLGRRTGGERTKGRVLPTRWVE